LPGKADGAIIGIVKNHVVEQEVMEQFWHACIPLFVAFDGVGLVPLYWALTQRLSPRQRRQAVTEAVTTVLWVALGFLLVIRWVFSLMGLRLGDVMVAGGAILFALSLRELVLPERPSRERYASPGVVPMGVPLLAGPAALTMLLLVKAKYGWVVTLAALTANLVVIWALLRGAEWLMERMGREGARVVSKITSLILTAFGVMLAREGVTMWFQP
jgi:multiple antibiotic resistance protein